MHSYQSSYCEMRNTLHSLILSFKDTFLYLEDQRDTLRKKNKKKIFLLKQSLKLRHFKFISPNHLLGCHYKWRNSHCMSCRQHYLNISREWPWSSVVSRIILTLGVSRITLTFSCLKWRIGVRLHWPSREIRWLILWTDLVDFR